MSPLARALFRIVAVAVLVVVAPRLPVSAHHPSGFEYPSGPDHEFGEMVDYPLVFPVDGPHTLADWFFAPRSGGSLHHAQDIMAARWTPVLAAASGTVIRINGTSNPDNLPNQEKCCTLILLHDDGWRSWYWHLNNDSAHLPPGECDGQGWGIADDITIGSTVEAGQLIGWVGSSGNASCDWPHLHFELHDPHGVIVNPYESLKNPVDPPEPVFCDGPESGCTRLAGPTRYETAKEVSKAHHPEPEATDLVYVASGANFPDALAGAAVAALAEAPVLLVQPDAVPEAAALELARLQPLEIILLGGEASISAGVADALGAEEFGSPTVTRVSGSDRYATAVEISRHTFADGEPDAVVLASGEGFADALSAGTLAASLNAPVLLTRGAQLPDIVLEEILRLDPERVLVLGGSAVISDEVLGALGTVVPVERVAGPNRYATGVESSKRAFPNGATPVERVYVTVGTNFPDGLTGGAAAGMFDSPILLVPSDHLPDVVVEEILRLAPSFVVILGGPNSVGPDVEHALKSLVSHVVVDDEDAEDPSTEEE